MKAIYYFLLFTASLLHAVAEDHVVIEEFKKLPLKERQEIIQKASPQLQNKLYNINAHLMQKESYGEKGYQQFLEERIIEERGFKGLTILFSKQFKGWSDFLQDSLNNKINAMKDPAEATPAQQVFNKEYENAWAIYRAGTHAVAQVAKSPEAYELDRLAVQAVKELDERYPDNGTIKIQKTDLKDLDKVVDQFLNKIKKLPQLTPEQVKSEIAALPETQE